MFRPIAFRPIAFTAFAASLVCQGWGQAISQEEAVKKSLSTHPRALAARSQALAARSGLSSARALRNLEIALNPALTADGAENEFVASQFFEINGARRARSSAAASRLVATQAAQATELRSLAFDTIRAHIALARLQERLQAERELLEVAEELERIARRQVEVGTRPGIDLVNVEIATIRQRRAVREAEAELRSARTSLASFVGGDADAIVAELMPIQAVQPQANADAAIQARSEVAEQSALAEALAWDRREVEAQGRPDLGLQALSGSFTREPRTAGLGLLITLPILDHGARRGRIAELRRLEEAQRHRVDATRREVRTDVMTAFERATAAQATLATFQDGLLERARRLLHASRIGFQAGQTSLVALLEAQRTYRAVQTEYVQARADYALALADLQRASGTLAADLIQEATK